MARAWMAIQAELRAGSMPGGALLDGLLVLLGGILLLTPGILTDLTGFLLLVPTTRGLFRGWLRKRLDRAIRTGQTSFTILIGP
ncbi:MAG TPA: FxsA family protein [Longimicrobiales bacterium]|nr:FxsA family protein [Longimicrobiales bacterium]